MHLFSQEKYIILDLISAMCLVLKNKKSWLEFDPRKIIILF